MLGVGLVRARVGLRPKGAAVGGGRGLAVGGVFNPSLPIELIDLIDYNITLWNEPSRKGREGR